MTDAEIADYVLKNVKPLGERGDYFFMYRCAATLTDGLLIPCVAVKPKASRVDLAIRRLEETRGTAFSRLWGRSPKKDFDYRSIVENFACGGVRLPPYFIRTLHETDYAL